MCERRQYIALKDTASFYSKLFDSTKVSSDIWMRSVKTVGVVNYTSGTIAVTFS